MKLAKKKTLFDDPAAEIQDLTYIIKKDITSLTQQIENITALKSTDNQQTEKNCDNIINTLKTKLAKTTTEFRKILEIRTETIKDQHRSRLEFTGSHSSYANTYQPYSESFENQSPNEVAINMPVQALSVTTHDYSRGRLEAVQSVESTIKELEGMFIRLASIVSEQTEMLERIDAESNESQTNIERAQEQLLKYYAALSSSRSLTVKIFVVLIVFVILFIVFFV